MTEVIAGLKRYLPSKNVRQFAPANQDLER